jgi:hypothetical protein
MVIFVILKFMLRAAIMNSRCRHLSNIRLLSDVKGTSTKDSDFYNFKIPVKGGHYEYSPPALQ